LFLSSFLLSRFNHPRFFLLLLGALFPTALNKAAAPASATATAADAPPPPQALKPQQTLKNNKRLLRTITHSLLIIPLFLYQSFGD
jgi:hypothetical protein